MLRYCKKCLMPDTKPDLTFDEQGVCSACRNYSGRESVDWDERMRELRSILDRYRSADGSNYDCIVPVSGGKDSTFQVVKVLELGMNPLAVTATTCSLSDIGRKNIENLKSLGVDYVEVTINPNIRHKMNRIALIEVGDISWPEHATIFTIPVRLAVQMKIPLLIWGENPQQEYGGPAADSNKPYLDRNWLLRFGGLLGMTPEDFVAKHGIDRKHMIQFSYPSDEELKSVGVTGLFLGHYLPWDSLRNLFVAMGHGLTVFDRVLEGSLSWYENLDNDQAGIHDYFKYLKYGYARATDVACLHIRNGRLSRSEALELVRKHDGSFPWTYLGRRIEDTLAEIDMTLEEFVAVCDRYTTKSLFQCDADGNLIRDKTGKLTKVNDDNPE